MEITKNITNATHMIQSAPLDTSANFIISFPQSNTDFSVSFLFLNIHETPLVAREIPMVYGRTFHTKKEEIDLHMYQDSNEMRRTIFKYIEG